MKRQHTLKIICVMLLCIALFGILCISCAAESTETLPEQITETEEFSNIFDTIYSELEKNADKLLSALAFVGSVIIALTYKRGLMPTLKNSLGALINSVNNMKEENDRGISTLDTTAKNISEKLESTEHSLTELAKSLEKIETALAESATNMAKAHDLRKILSSQVDMLYEIFMTSSLPQYKKDEVGEKISEMRKSLTPEEEDNA